MNTEVAALVEYLRKLTNKDNRKKSIEKFFNGFIRFACYRAKLEIFAFFKSNPMISPIFEGKFITQKEKNDGFYDFFRPDEIGFPMSLVSFFDKRLFNEIAKNKEEEYKKTIDEATNAMFQLEINGMSREKIIGVLQDEPLDRWNKIFERIKISDEYNKIKEKSN